MYLKLHFNYGLDAAGILEAVLNPRTQNHCSLSHLVFPPASQFVLLLTLNKTGLGTYSDSFFFVCVGQ